MSMLESVPAVRRLDTDRPSLQAFDIVGHVSSADVENLFGLLEAAYLLHPRLDVLIRIFDFDGIDWSEVDAATIDEGRRHAAEHVRRCAIVGDRYGRTEAGGFFLKTAGVECQEFDVTDEQQAWDWLASSGT